MQEFYGECMRFLLQFPLGGDSRCQSEAQSLLTKDRGTQCHELNRLRKADNLMQVVDAARVPGQGDVRERCEQTALFRHDAEICTEREPAARARRCAVHHRNHRFAALSQSERRLSRQHGEFIADEFKGRHLLDVAACGEILARAREDDHLHRFVRITMLHSRNQIAKHLRVQCVV